MKILCVIFASLVAVSANGQNAKASMAAKPARASSAEERSIGYQQRLKLASTSLVNNIPLTSVGPTVMSGRVVDLEVNPRDASQFYVAFASGGLWKTTNNGNTFTPLFDHEMVMTIGDIAVDWNHNEIIYVGTGENNSSRSSYAGTGIYKSTDKGAHWQHLGLDNTHHIGRIILHPTDTSLVWVAALGHLYSPNKERGVYKSTDAGRTWKQTLYVDDKTGAIDLVINKLSTQILFCSMWHRERAAWNFVESGATSGIYQSVDGGDTWKLVSGPGSGFPQGDGNGRIGLGLSHNNATIIYAVLDNQARQPKQKPDSTTGNSLNRDTLRSITDAAFLTISDATINEYLDKNNFPEKYSAAGIKQMVRDKKIAPKALVEYLEDANSLLFDTDVIGAEVYRSTDGGSTWSKQNNEYIKQLYNTYGYYFGQVTVSPFNDDEIYLPGFQILKSTDAGKTFKSILADNVHVDFHHAYVNPNRRGHIILANDGGLNVSYDSGATYVRCNTPPVGQFYSINYDFADPFNLYGGLQDNGVWQWKQEAEFGYIDNENRPYKFLMGGDGMQVQIDPRDNNTLYTGYQFGNYSRIDIASGKEKPITPIAEIGEPALRWNWNAPLIISPHNSDIIYMGSNKMHRSMNRGEGFVAISNDLTQGGKKGDVAYGTLTTISESPLQFGLLYSGSDDGLVHVSRDGGYSWQKISSSFPPNLWVSRVVASAHSLSRVYVALNGYRWDNFDAILYSSDDYGATWTKLGNDLPLEPINVVREDPTNPDIIYCGTDHGVYVSVNGGKQFMQWSGGMPCAPVHDLVIHPRDNKIIIGTHGRSAYMGDVSLVQQLNDTLMAKPLHVFDMDKIMHSARWGKRMGPYGEFNVPEQTMAYWSASADIAVLNVYSLDSILLSTKFDTCERGINFLKYNLNVDSVAMASYMVTVNKEKDEKQKMQCDKAEDGKYYLIPGEYIFEFKNSHATVRKQVQVKARERKKRGG